MFVPTESNFIISLFDGVKSLDKIAVKAGIFLGSETGLQYYIIMLFTIYTILFINHTNSRLNRKVITS
jgi:hypothetical protein